MLLGGGGAQLVLVGLLVHHADFPVDLYRGLQRRPHAGHHRGVPVSFSICGIAHWNT